MGEEVDGKADRPEAAAAVAAVEDATEAVANIQKLEDRVRKHEKNKDKELGEEIKAQRI